MPAKQIEKAPDSFGFRFGKWQTKSDSSRPNDNMPSHHNSKETESRSSGTHGKNTMRHRTYVQRHANEFNTMSSGDDDADAAAGGVHPPTISLSPTQHRKRRPLATPVTGSETDLLRLSTHDVNEGEMEKENSAQQQQVLVLGFDVTHLSRRNQFLTCAGGLFFFSLWYSYLQELLSVKLCNRQLGLFLAMMQFIGYTGWSFLLRTYVNRKERRYNVIKNTNIATGESIENGSSNSDGDISVGETKGHPKNGNTMRTVPLNMYIGIALIRAFDLAMTNLAMQYINYPAKTLMKSSRVVFTMLFGVLFARKRYPMGDYFTVLLMVSGLVVFMHADSNSDAVFHPLGIIMLVASLLSDGACTNMSEAIMNNYGVSQDEYIFRLYSLALVAISMAAAYKGDLAEGLRFMMVPGTLSEINEGLEPTWSVMTKFVIMFMFSTTGFLGSSCSAAITKQFGAMTMSITSTVRKATTLFLSFALFNNYCTIEHVGGIVLFLIALIMKTVKHSSASRSKQKNRKTSGADVHTGGAVEVPRVISAHHVENEHIV